jgi:hypothetical protein
VVNRFLAASAFALFCLPSFLVAGGEYYAGVMGGVSTLSADARSMIAPTTTALSLYKPENGPTFNLFVGRHVSDYLSFQANYIGNRNSLTLNSTSFAGQSQLLYEEMRTSSQHSVLGDVLLYFRNRRSSVRPYLSMGTGLVQLRSAERSINALIGSPKLPPQRFTSTALALRVAVGIDVALRRGWAFRYSFSETIRDNAISAHLTPPGERNLANFQNLFGFVKNF